MPLKINDTVHTDIYRSSSATGKLLGETIASKLQSFTNMQRHAAYDINVAASGTETLSLGDIDNVKGLRLEFDGDANVTLNGATDPLQARRPDATTGRQAKLAFDGVVTQIDVMNPSTTAALTGFVVLWGDPT